MDSYFGYKPCSCCGKYADDGAYIKVDWYCLDCADKRPKMKSLLSLLSLRINSMTVKPSLPSKIFGVEQTDDLHDKQLEYHSGVFSHETAVMLHTLSTYSPFYYHISFPKGYHSENAREQYVKPHHTTEHELSDEYIELMDSWDSNPIRVTNLEKTIIDMLRYKWAVPGIVEEMIDDYITRNDKNIDKLTGYADRFNVLDIIKERILPFIKGVE